jgi:hypothetical protein
MTDHVVVELSCLLVYQFVNGHKGNQFLRELAVARKGQFDTGSYSEKRVLATEIVSIVKELNPPGRFLRVVKPGKPLEGSTSSMLSEYSWEELDLEKSIHKACQVMRDIDRLDRKHRLERKLARMNREQSPRSFLNNNESKMEGDENMTVQQEQLVERTVDAIVAMESDIDKCTDNKFDENEQLKRRSDIN